MGPGLQPVRQKVRHLLAQGYAPRPTLQKGLRRPAAQQQAGALGAVQPLVPRHGNEGGPQLTQGKGQAAGRLGGIHDQGDPPAPAQGGDVLDGQDEAEHIGNMGAHRRPHLRGQRPAEGLQSGRPVKQGAVRHPHRHPRDGPERPGDCVVLITGDHHGVPRPDQGFDGQIQPVGGIESKDHLFRLRHIKEGGGLLPAGKGGVRRRHSGPVSPPAWAGQMADGPGAGPGHLRRLL